MITAQLGLLFNNPKEHMYPYLCILLSKIHIWKDLIIMTKEAHWKPMRRHPNVYEYQLKYGKRYGVRFTYYDGEHKRHEYKKSGFQD